MLQHIHTCIRECTQWRLWRERKGSVTMFMGIGLLTLVAATGSAVDMSRLQSVRAKLSNSLDAAGLAAGTKVNSANVDEVVTNYMNANFPADFLDSTITNITVTVNTDSTIINLSATASVKMNFMQVFGVESLDVTATSEITRENRGLELVMVLDTTGSMYGTKITDLREAASNMVTILFGQKNSLDNLWVGIVPYVTGVNIGSSNTSWLRDYDLTRYPANYPASGTKWKGCVEERNQYPDSDLDGDGIPMDMSDEPPYTGDKSIATPEQLATTFPMWFWESSAVDNPWIAANGSVSLNQNAGYSDTAARGPNVGCGDAVTPFLSDRDQLLAKIAALNPWRRGGTMSSTGLAWGWRMISPRWRGLWAHADAKLPLNYHTPLMNKAVILMTDGVNEVFTPYSNPPGGSDYTAYRRIGEERLGAGINTRAEGVTAINSRTAAMCATMKARGILIYTVTFQLANTTAANNARALFRSCASHPDFYFDSPDGATLKKAFRQIGDSLANLMISR